MMRCKHNDCFTCPYTDCISDTAPKGARKKRQKITKEEAKRRKTEYNRKYYLKNAAHIAELHRKRYQDKKEGTS